MTLKFLYTDDKTGKFSDTTLRTWIVFGIFFLYAVFLCFAHVLFIVGKLTATVSPQILDSSITLLDVLGVAAFGGGFLYLSKRINERKAGFLNTGNSAAPSASAVRAGVSYEQSASNGALE